ncbi:acid protease [Xylaria sp. FL0933]|nr:acid protease [Xylaria sp. FL0933]
MISVFLLAFVAVGIAGDITRNGAHSLRLPIRSRGSSSIGTRDDPGYGDHPLKTNATQKHYLSPYTVEIAIGSPPQLVYPAIDLFTSNLWVDPDCYASFSYEACCKNGHYNPDASTTADELDCSQPWGFSTPYGEASGCTVDDDVHFAGADIGLTNIGVANASWAQTAGRFGLGFGCEDEDDISVLDILKALGLIATRQFGIALGSANPNADYIPVDASGDVGLGELLFSGLNTRKYTGELQKLRSHRNADDDSRYYITLTSIGFSDLSNCSEVSFDGFPLPVHAFLDYTTLISYLPWSYIDTISGFFPPVTYNATSEFYEVPCYHRAQDASVDFYFDPLTIRVPLHDFILEVDGICFLGVQLSAQDDEAILGQSFLRGAYTAFDVDDAAIYMAQYENCGDEVIEWDSSASQEEGLCAGKPTTLPASCYATSTRTTSTSTSTSMSRSTSTHTTTHSTTSTTHSTSTSHSTSHSTTHSSTHTSTHSTTSSRTSYRISSTASSRTSNLTTTSSSKSSTRSSSRPATTSSSTHSSTKTTSSTKRSSSQSHISSATGAYPTTSSPWSSGLLSSGHVSGGSATFWTQGPSSGASWSNVSFTATPGSTGRWTPTGTSLTSTFHRTSSESYSSETSTLTSLPASTSNTQRSSSRSVHSATHSISMGDSDEEKTVTVTVGVLTSTVFMPSPITMPATTCDCAGTAMMGREADE